MLSFKCYDLVKVDSSTFYETINHWGLHMTQMGDNELLAAAIRAAVAAGKAICGVYHTDFSVEHKADDSPVTLADRLSHEIIERLLAPLGIPLLSEEGKEISPALRQKWDIFWLVDPLDGTKEFIKRNGEFTVNIALIKEKRPVLGVIYIPAADRLYFGAQGMGSYANEQAAAIIAAAGSPENERGILETLMKRARRLPVHSARNSVLTVVGSRSHTSAEFDAFVESMRKTYGDIRLAPAGSSLKFCLLAEGSADIYPRFGHTMEWDTAAGQALVENAGMRMLDYRTGDPLQYNKESLLNPWFIAEKPDLPVFRAAPGE